MGVLQLPSNAARKARSQSTAVCDKSPYNNNSNNKDSDDSENKNENKNENGKI